MFIYYVEVEAVQDAPAAPEQPDENENNADEENVQGKIPTIL